MDPGELLGVGTMGITDNAFNSEVRKAGEGQHTHIYHIKYCTDLVCDERGFQTICWPGIWWLGGMFSKG